MALSSGVLECVMRLISLVAAVTAVFAIFSLSTTSAVAGGWERSHPPQGWGRAQTVRRWVYRPRYRYQYKLHSRTDPYRYTYEPRGYYPYYGSRYWRPLRSARKRYHFHAPRYYPAWGKKRRGWKHRKWHYRNHGRIRSWQW